VRHALEPKLKPRLALKDGRTIETLADAPECKPLTENIPSDID